MAVVQRSGVCSGRGCCVAPAGAASPLEFPRPFRPLQPARGVVEQSLSSGEPSREHGWRTSQLDQLASSPLPVDDVRHASHGTNHDAVHESKVLETGLASYQAYAALLQPGKLRYHR